MEKNLGKELNVTLFLSLFGRETTMIKNINSNNGNLLEIIKLMMK